MQQDVGQNLGGPVFRDVVFQYPFDDESSQTGGLEFIIEAKLWGIMHIKEWERVPQVLGEDQVCQLPQEYPVIAF